MPSEILHQCHWVLVDGHGSVWLPNVLVQISADVLVGRVMLRGFCNLVHGLPNLAESGCELIPSYHTLVVEVKLPDKQVHFLRHRLKSVRSLKNFENFVRSDANPLLVGEVPNLSELLVREGRHAESAEQVHGEGVRGPERRDPEEGAHERATGR